MIPCPEVTPGEAVVVSATLYTTYLRCPQQSLGRLYGHYPAESLASFRGGLAHRLFARHLAEGPIDESGIELAAKEEIGKSLNPKLSALGLKPSDLAGVIREVGALYDRFKAVSADGFQAAEVFIERVVSDGVLLRGSVDAVFDEADGNVRLVDWKTGGIAGAEHQLAFYAMLWAMEHGRLPARVEAMSVATGERFEAVPSLEHATETVATVARLVSELRTAWGDSGELERRAGRWCRYCPILSDCAEGAAAVAVFSSG